MALRSVALDQFQRLVLVGQGEAVLREVSSLRVGNREAEKPRKTQGASRCTGCHSNSPPRLIALSTPVAGDPEGPRVVGVWNILRGLSSPRLPLPTAPPPRRPLAIGPGLEALLSRPASAEENSTGFDGLVEQNCPPGHLPHGLRLALGHLGHASTPGKLVGPGALQCPPIATTRSFYPESAITRQVAK